MTSDWKEVYRQEQKRPGYVIDNGKMPPGHPRDVSIKRTMTTLRPAKKKAA